MGLQHVVAAHHDVEQPIARGLLGIGLARRAGQNGGIDARHERRRQGHLVRIEAVEIRQAEIRGGGNVTQRHLDETSLGRSAR